MKKLFFIGVLCISFFFLISPVQAAEREAETPPSDYSGLTYEYYYLGEGGVSALPDFDALTPTETGSVSTFSFDELTTGEYFAYRFTGYIQVSKSGMYTFYTNSDDGSALYIGDERVVDNDGAHSEKEESGQIELAAGYHKITVLFFDNKAHNILEVYYSSSTLSKQLIPSSVLSGPNAGDDGSGSDSDSGNSNSGLSCTGSKIKKVSGMKNGKVKVTFKNGVVKKQKVFYTNAKGKKTIPKILKNQKGVLVLGPHAVKLKIFNGCSGSIKDSRNLGTKKHDEKIFRFIDLRKDGSKEALILSKKINTVRATVTRIKQKRRRIGNPSKDLFAAENINLSDTKIFNGKKNIQVMNTGGETVRYYRITKDDRLTVE